jgi:terminal uridylyltransferase
MDFFRFYAREFSYNISVVSIKNGLLTKESKGWHNDVRSFGIHYLRQYLSDTAA